MQKDYFNIKENQVYSLEFKLITALLMALAIIPVVMGYLGIKGYYLEKAPCWLLNVYFWMGIVTAVSAVGIYFLRKIAVFSYIVFVFLLYVFFLLAYGAELHDSVFTIFIFIGLGLYGIIPRWKFFK